MKMLIWEIDSFFFWKMICVTQDNTLVFFKKVIILTCTFVKV